MSERDSLRPLLDAAAEGDDRATSELVRRTQPDVWRLCVALGSDGSEEDLVQETYLRALKSLDSYRGDAPVRSWLLAVARNVCADDVRRRTRQRRLIDRVTPLAREEATSADPHDTTHAFLADLTADRREAFVLTQVLGLSYEEAAESIGCPIGTVRSRVARARQDLATAVRRSEAI